MKNEEANSESDFNIYNNYNDIKDNSPHGDTEDLSSTESSTKKDYQEPPSRFPRIKAPLEPIFKDKENQKFTTTLVRKDGKIIEIKIPKKYNPEAEQRAKFAREHAAKQKQKAAQKAALEAKRKAQEEASANKFSARKHNSSIYNRNRVEDQQYTQGRQQDNANSFARQDLKSLMASMESAEQLLKQSQNDVDRYQKRDKEIYTNLSKLSALVKSRSKLTHLSVRQELFRLSIEKDPKIPMLGLLNIKPLRKVWCRQPWLKSTPLSKESKALARLAERHKREGYTNLGFTDDYFAVKTPLKMSVTEAATSNKHLVAKKKYYGIHIVVPKVSARRNPLRADLTSLARLGMSAKDLAFLNSYRPPLKPPAGTRGKPPIPQPPENSLARIEAEKAKAAQAATKATTPAAPVRAESKTQAQALPTIDSSKSKTLPQPKVQIAPPPLPKQKVQPLVTEVKAKIHQEEVKAPEHKEDNPVDLVLEAHAQGRLQKGVSFTDHLGRKGNSKKKATIVDSAEDIIEDTGSLERISEAEPLEIKVLDFDLERDIFDSYFKATKEAAENLSASTAGLGNLVDNASDIIADSQATLLVESEMCEEVKTYTLFEDKELERLVLDFDYETYFQNCLEESKKNSVYSLNNELEKEEESLLESLHEDDLLDAESYYSPLSSLSHINPNQYGTLDARNLILDDNSHKKQAPAPTEAKDKKEVETIEAADAKASSKAPENPTQEANLETSAPAQTANTTEASAEVKVKDTDHNAKEVTFSDSNTIEPVKVTKAPELPKVEEKPETETVSKDETVARTQASDTEKAPAKPKKSRGFPSIFGIKKGSKKFL